VRGLAALAVAALAAGPSAQVLQLERRAYSRILELRTELVRSWVVAEAPLRARIQRELEGEAKGNPFVPIARALAAARGVECDAAFLFRTAIHCFALPEVVDPVEFKELAVTMHMPFGVPVPGGVRFDIVGQEGGPGTPAPLAVIEQDTGQDDLERFRAVAKIPVERLGRPVTVRAISTIDGAPQRDADPAADAPVRVIPGYSARAKSLSAERRSLEGKAAADDLAVLDGALSAVERVWTGEPRGGLFDARTDLEACERMLANVVERRPILFGVGASQRHHGVPAFTIGLAAGEGRSWTCTLDGRACERTPRCLVVVVPGTPTWPTHLGAPSSPEATPPGFVWSQLDAAELPQALAGRAAAVVVLESPGRVQLPAENLPHACAALRRLLGAADAPLVLLAERDGATVVSSALERAPGFAQAVVLVEGGSFQPATIRQTVAELPILGIVREGKDTGENLRRAARAAKAAGLTTFTLREAPLLPRDLALAAAVEHVLPWLGKLELKAASRPSTR
jgi:hypothetical protein